MRIKDLSPHLRSIYELELGLGNEFFSLLEPPEAIVPLVIYLARPLHFSEIHRQLKLSVMVEYYEFIDDHHYPPEAGFRCRETGHMLIGLLEDRRSPLSR